MMHKFLITVLVSSFFIACANHPKESKEDVLQIIEKVNDYWQTNHPNHGNSFWHHAAYHTGNMAAYEITNNDAYLNYSTEWAEQNKWMGAQSNDTINWKYSYGESDDFVLFGDFQTCFQLYTDLYKLNPDEKKIARARGVMEYQMSTPQNDYLWWADGLYMVMPGMTRLYKITENEQYLAKLYDYFSFARDLMYDNDDHLFFRDAKYIYPNHKSKNGKKDFWARGNGWVFAALARVLQDLPKTHPHRSEYISIYNEMAEAIAKCQQNDGYWSRSMLDEEHASGPETSGTAFFVYGYLWGINNGILSENTYKSTVENGWNYLINTAIQPNGLVGYVQPIGERADQHVVNKETTADFGVGAVLLAASERVKYLNK